MPSLAPEKVMPRCGRLPSPSEGIIQFVKTGFCAVDETAGVRAEGLSLGNPFFTDPYLLIPCVSHGSVCHLERLIKGKFWADMIADHSGRKRKRECIRYTENLWKWMLHMKKSH